MRSVCGGVESADLNFADTTYTVQVKEGDAVVASGDLKQLPVRKRVGHRHHKRHHRHGTSKAQGGDPGQQCNKADQGHKA